jgi:ribose 5-phosphate isomerase A
VSKDSDVAKTRVAQAAADLVEPGMVVGLGSGSTASLMVQRLGQRIEEEGLKILGVPTSVATADLARRLLIPLRELDDVPRVDINLDGADEVDAQFRMIKGRGGALLREKIVASSAAWRVTMITPEKRVDQIGCNAPIPVEVSPVGLRHTERRLQKLGAETSIRRTTEGSPYLTDGGNAIIDCRFFSNPGNPEELDARLQSVVGVFETGIFLGLCDTLLIGSEESFERIDAQPRSTAADPDPTAANVTDCSGTQ